MRWEKKKKYNRCLLSAMYPACTTSLERDLICNHWSCNRVKRDAPSTRDFEFRFIVYHKRKKNQIVDYTTTTLGKEETRYEAHHVLHLKEEEAQRILALYPPFWWNAFISALCGVGTDIIYTFITLMVDKPLSFTSTFIKSILATVFILCICTQFRCESVHTNGTVLFHCNCIGTS